MMACPPEISTLIYQNADLFGRVNEMMDRQTQAEERLAKDRQDHLNGKLL